MQLRRVKCVFISTVWNLNLKWTLFGQTVACFRRPVSPPVGLSVWQPRCAAAFKCAPVPVTGGHPVAPEPRDGLTAAVLHPRRTSAAAEVSLSKRLPLYPAGVVRRKDCPPALSPISSQLALIFFSLFFVKHAMQLLQWSEAVK